MRKTKIICTLGPSTDKDDVLDQLITGGMNVARLNFSHGTHAQQKARIDRVKELRHKYEQPVAIMLDTKGPEIRTGNFEHGRETLSAGQSFTLTCENIIGNNSITSITYPSLYKDVKAGSHILIDDGLIELVVQEIKNKDIICRVVNGGTVSDHKGINIPGIHLNMEYLSEKDKSDILFGIENEVDFIAASFVRSAEDINDIKNLLKNNNGERIKIIAKIENREGVDNIDEIIEVSDGVMVARGDMGVELPCEEVPILQKMIIKKACEKGKHVITATQMLDSMIKNPRPTRAESTDVANAIYDGTSAIMLSGETAAGAYPVEAFLTMSKIAVSTEKSINYKKRFYEKDRNSNPDVTDAICHATCTTALDLNAEAILTVTKSGTTAYTLSKYRPSCNIIGGAIDKFTCYQLNMAWGVTPVLLEEKSDVLELFEYAVNCAKNKGYVAPGSLVVVTSGIPLGLSGTTNMLKVEGVK